MSKNINVCLCNTFGPRNKFEIYCILIIRAFIYLVIIKQVQEDLEMRSYIRRKSQYVIFLEGVRVMNF